MTTMMTRTGEKKMDSLTSRRRFDSLHYETSAFYMTTIRWKKTQNSKKINKEQFAAVVEQVTIETEGLWYFGQK